MKIAVIGSGISGNSAAWALSRTHDVTIYEERNRPGGHSATVDIDHTGRRISVDTGFIVYNEQNYPLLTKLFDHLDVATERSQMSFSVSLDSGKLEWCGTKLKGIFAQRRNLFSPGFLRMLCDIFVFNERARKDLQSGALCGLTLNDYLSKRGFSKRLKDDYLVPMTSAIWSTPSTKMLEFPAESLIRFMKNHSLIQKQRPKWRTVSGGSREYVKKLVADTRADWRIGRSVKSLTRSDIGVTITDHLGNTDTFDHVVLATHSDQSLAMISDASPLERELLGSVRYTKNDVWLHRDTNQMPKRRNAWAAWNYLGGRNSEDERDVSVTYWMNKLQNIDENHPIFVTLNPLKAPDPALTFDRFSYSHPLFDKAAIDAQERLSEIQGKNRLWFCGAWCGYGFHEDGLKSGLDVANALGGIIPWEENAETVVPLPHVLQAANQSKPFIEAAE